MKTWIKTSWSFLQRSVSLALGVAGGGAGGRSLLTVNTLEAGPWLAARKLLSRGFFDSFPSGLLSCPSRWPSSYHFLSRVSHSAFKGNSYTLKEEKYILFFFRLTSKRSIGLIKHIWLACSLPTPKLTSVFSSVGQFHSYSVYTLGHHVEFIWTSKCSIEIQASKWYAITPISIASFRDVAMTILNSHKNIWISRSSSWLEMKIVSGEGEMVPILFQTRGPCLKGWDPQVW